MRYLTGDLTIDWCGPEHASQVHALTQAAFAPQAALDPPSGATRETLEVVRADLTAGRGVLAVLGERPVAAARLVFEDDHVVVRRVAVDPKCQGQGIGRSVMAWIHEGLRQEGYREVRLGVRKALTVQQAFYERLGYGRRRDEGFWVGLRLSLAPEAHAGP